MLEALSPLSTVPFTDGTGGMGLQRFAVRMPAFVTYSIQRVQPCAVTGLGEAYPCATPVAVILPASLPPVVLFAGTEVLQQQVVTVVNVAGQAAAGQQKQPTSPKTPTPP